MVIIVSSVTGSALFFSSLHMCGVIGGNIMMYVFVIGEKRICNSNIYAL